jgi:hypothetical protein
MGAKDAAAQSAQIASLMPQAAALAWNVLVYNPGAAAIATAAQTAGMASGASLAAASGLASSMAVSGKAGGSLTSEIPHFAKGGIITRPTVGLIGEKPGNPEGVFPLKKLDQYFSGAGGTNITLYNSGDINNGSDLEDLLDGISDAVNNARRSG